MDGKPADKTGQLEAVLRDIKKGKTAPCYLLYGEEEYLIHNALEQITDLLIPPADRGMNLFVVEGEQENVDDICQSLLTLPLIPGRKIVVVKNTALFQSKKLLPSLIQRIRDRWENNPSQAASDFLQFLKLAGWKIADLRDGGWKRIGDEEWLTTVEGDKGEDREQWLPNLVEFCVKHDLDSTEGKEGHRGLSKVLAGGLPEGNHLILTAQAVDKRKQLFKQIAESGEVLYFSHEKSESKQRYMVLELAQEFLAERKKQLTPDAWEALGKKTGFDFRESISALDKLIAYTGEHPTVHASDVEAIIGKTKEETVFDLTSALVDKNLPQGLVTLADLLGQGIHHLVILKMLTREIRLLLYAKLLAVSGTIRSYSPTMDFNSFQAKVYSVIKKEKGLEILTGQHPYVLYKLLRNAERFSQTSLVRYLEYLADVDLMLRSTGKDPKLMLENFLVEVCLG